jgi:hypothetical protein
MLCHFRNQIVSRKTVNFYQKTGTHFSLNFDVLCANLSAKAKPLIFKSIITSSSISKKEIFWCWNFVRTDFLLVFIRYKWYTRNSIDWLSNWAKVALDKWLHNVFQMHFDTNILPTTINSVKKMASFSDIVGWLNFEEFSICMKIWSFHKEKKNDIVGARKNSKKTKYIWIKKMQ